MTDFRTDGPGDPGSTSNTFSLHPRSVPTVARPHCRSPATKSAGSAAPPGRARAWSSLLEPARARPRSRALPPGEGMTRRCLHQGGLLFRSPPRRLRKDASWGLPTSPKLGPAMPPRTGVPGPPAAAPPQPSPSEPVAPWSFDWRSRPGCTGPVAAALPDMTVHAGPQT